MNVQPWPRSPSLKALRPMRIERSTLRRSTISFSVMSLRSSIMRKTKSAYASMRESRLRPCGRGDNSPIFDRADTPSAEAAARQAATNQRSEVVIHRPNGQIRYRNSYVNCGPHIFG